jgi:hypothetical protein
MYWYISEPKLQLLKSRSLGLTLRDLVIRLGFPGVGGAEASLHFTHELQRDVQHVERSARVAPDIRPFEDLPDDASPDKFWFDCTAARLIDSEAFWVAGRKGSSALLLVGSSANALGGSLREDGRISPTADPLGACRAVFEGSERASPVESSFALRYVWGQVMATIPEGTLAMPRVEGLAVFGGTFRFEGTDPSLPQRLVLGSPVYVKQV